MANRYIRTSEDALEVIVHAKHTAEELHPVTQVFYHPTTEESDTAKREYRLIDVDEAFITKLEEGESFVFRGTGDERLVLCTDTETFEVKEGEISNALIVVPDLLYSQDVKNHGGSEHKVVDKKITTVMSSYLELRPTFPKLKKLREILSEHAYKGPDEDDGSETGYYFCDLLDKIQCSREELKTALNDIPACCVDNRWQLLDVEYESRVLSQIINLAEERSWAELPRMAVCRALESTIPDCVLEHVFKHFTEQVNDQEDDLRKWKNTRVCRSFGETLLRAGEGKFRHNEFMMAWMEFLPKGMEPDLESLRGLAITEKEGTQQEVILLFPEYILPENLAERFRLLFKRKEKWTLREITPYVEKLTSTGINVSMMLTKHSRPSTVNGVRVFGARHLK